MTRSRTLQRPSGASDGSRKVDADRRSSLGTSMTQRQQNGERVAAALVCVPASRFICSRICDIVGEHATSESMATLRDDIADIEACLYDAEDTARDLPHREKYLRLVLGFMRRLLELHLKLVDEVERKLAVRRPNSAPKA